MNCTEVGGIRQFGIPSGFHLWLNPSREHSQFQPVSNKMERLNDISAKALGLLVVLGGILVFVVQHTIVHFYLTPAQNLKKLIGEIAYSLDYYANQLWGKSAKGDEARDVYRQQACRLRDLSQTIPSYWIFSKVFRVLPPERNLEEASKCLMALSNTPYERDGFARPSEECARIRELLRLKRI